MDGLKRIILIDSYIRSETIEIRLDGHTVINGKNGKGKSSLLRLVPLFYGAMAGSLVKKGDGGNLGFVDYYLPRDGSYIIYEYQANNRLMMSVFTNLPNSRDTFRRILVDSPYAESLFYNREDTQSLPSESLIPRIHKVGASYKACKTIDEYKQLLLESGRGQFSIASQGSRLGRLTNLLAGMFERKASFDDLSKVIQDWSMGSLDDDARNTITTFSIGKDELTKTVNDFSALSGLDALLGDIKPIKECVSDCEQMLGDQAAIYVVAKERALSLTKKNREISEEYTEFKDLTDVQKSELTIAITHKNETLKSLGSKRLESNQQVSDIEKRHANYIQSGVDDYEIEIKSIESKSGELERLKQSVNNDENQADQISNQINSDKLEINAETETAIEELHELKDKSNTYKSGKLKNIQDKKDHRLSSFDEQTSTHSLVLLNQREKINYDLVVAENSVITAIASSESLITLEQARENENKANQLVLDEQQSLNELMKSSAGFKSDLREAEKELDISIEHKERLESEITSLINLRDEEGTLYKFLKENKPGWQSTFGKILSNSVLMNKRLSPMIDAPSDSLFGVSLDLDVVPEKAVDIEAKIAELKPQVELARKDDRDAEATLDKAFKTTSQIDRNIGFKELSLRQAVNRLTTLSELVKTSVNQVAAEVKRAKHQAEEDVKRLISEKKVADEEFKQYQLARESEKKLLINAFENDKHEINENHTQVIEGITRKIIDIQDRRKNEINRLDDDLQRQLSGAGLDADKLKERKLAIKSLTNDVKLLIKKRSEFEVFKHFVDFKYTTLPKLKSNADKDEEAYQSLFNEINEVKRQRRDLSEVFEKEEVRVSNLIKTNEMAISTLNILINTQDEPDSVINLDVKNQWESLSAEQLRARFTTYQSRQGDLLRDIRQKSDVFIKKFNLYSDAVCYRYYESAIAEHQRNNDPISVAKAICAYYDKGHHQTSIAALKNAISIIENIHSYKRFIEQFEGRVKAFGNKLNENMDESIRFENLSQVRLNLRFTPKNIEHWHIIEQLSESFKQWSDNHERNSLPSKDVIIAMRDFIDGMKTSRMGSSVSELWRQIQFHFEIIENGEPKTVSTEKGLGDVSSNGLSYLIMIVTFIGFIDVQRGKTKTPLTWSLDELSNIDDGNIEALLDMLKDKNISIIAACPKSDYMEVSRFTHRYRLETEGDRTIVINQKTVNDEDNPFEQQDEERVEGAIL